MPKLDPKECWDVKQLCQYEYLDVAFLQIYVGYHLEINSNYLYIYEYGFDASSINQMRMYANQKNLFNTTSRTWIEEEINIESCLNSCIQECKIK